MEKYKKKMSYLGTDVFTNVNIDPPEWKFLFRNEFYS